MKHSQVFLKVDFIGVNSYLKKCCTCVITSWKSW